MEITEEEQMIYVLWQAGFTLRSIGAIFDYHPQEIKNIGIRVAKQIKRMEAAPKPNATLSNLEGRDGG